MIGDDRMPGIVVVAANVCIEHVGRPYASCPVMSCAFILLWGMREERVRVLLSVRSGLVFPFGHLHERSHRGLSEG